MPPIASAFTPLSVEEIRELEGFLLEERDDAEAM